MTEPSYYYVNPFAVSPFTKLLGKRTGGVTARSKSWALKMVSEIYDARFQMLKDPNWRQIKLSSYVYELLSRRYGVKSIVDKQCWEFYLTCQKYRSEDRELDVFSWFLDEHFDTDDLTFFVEARHKARLLEDENGDLSQLSTVYVPEERITSLVTAIFGTACPPLSERVLELSKGMVGATPTPSKKFGSSRSISLSNFLIIALEQFRLHFNKPFPLVEPSSSAGGSSLSHTHESNHSIGSSATPTRAPVRRASPPPASRSPAPVAEASPAKRASIPVTHSSPNVSRGNDGEWQLTAQLADMREQLGRKTDRIYELEERLLAQGEGRAKLEGQLAQMKADYEHARRRVAILEKQPNASGSSNYGSDASDPPHTERLKSALKEQSDDLSTVHEKLIASESRNRELQAMLAHAEDASQEVTLLQEDNDRLSRKVASLESELAAYQGKGQPRVSSTDRQYDGPKDPMDEKMSHLKDMLGNNLDKAMELIRMLERGEDPESLHAQVRAANARAAVSLSSMSSDENLTQRMLTQVIREMEDKMRADAVARGNIEKQAAELSRRVDGSDKARVTAESKVAQLQSALVTVTADRDRIAAELVELQRSTEGIIARELDARDAEHEEEMAEMKKQMSKVMTKVMQEWERVKLAASKSTAVEEWLKLEEDLQREEESRKVAEARCEELEEKLSISVTTGGGGGPMYGGVLARIIADVVDMRNRFAESSSRPTVVDWRQLGQLDQDTSAHVLESVSRLQERFEMLEAQTVQLDEVFSNMIEDALKGRVDDAQASTLLKQLKGTIDSMRQSQDARVAPQEVVDFIDRMIGSLGRLERSLQESEASFLSHVESIFIASESEKAALKVQVQALSA